MPLLIGSAQSRRFYLNTGVLMELLSLHRIVDPSINTLTSTEFGNVLSPSPPSLPPPSSPPPSSCLLLPPCLPLDPPSEVCFLLLQCRVCRSHLAAAAGDTSAPPDVGGDGRGGRGGEEWGGGWFFFFLKRGGQPGYFLIYK